MLSRLRNPHEPWLYFWVGLLTLFCVFELGKLWHADLRYPIIDLSGDAILTQAVAFKGMVDNPWLLDNQWTGAPFGSNLRDFAGPDLLILCVIKALTLFTKNHNLIRNVVAIGSYPLVALTSLYVMRRLGIRSAIAAVASLLFAFLSYHQDRIGVHLFLAIGYFTVPLATLMALWFFEDVPLFLGRGLRGMPWRLHSNRVTWAACAWCAVMGMTGSVYYSFFSCYLFAIAGVVAAIRRGTMLPLARAFCAIGLVGASTVAGLLPVLVHHCKHGSTAMLERIPQDAETYGLKIVQMLIPDVGHRVGSLDRLSHYFNKVAPLVTENHGAYLGIFGAAGFLYLVFCLLTGKPSEGRTRSLSVFNIAIVLLATIGGFSSVLSFLLSSTIRSYNRASVFIAFFSLLALALAVEHGSAKWARRRARHVTLAVCLVVVAYFGLLDQYTQAIDYTDLKKRYIEQARFVEQIEQSVPTGSSIFQFPLVTFPEHLPVYLLTDYAEFEPYLHSKSLRWSYGTIKGRRGAAWQANIAGMPADQAADALAQAGFMGIYVARGGFRDHGAGLEETLKTKLGRPTAESANGEAAFYSLVVRVKQLKAELGDQEYERRKHEALTPMYLGWLTGCHPSELNGNPQSAWCGAVGHFVVDNPSAAPIHVVLAAKLTLQGDPPATVTLRSDILKRDIDLEHSNYDLFEGFDVPPGEHMFTITTSGQGLVDEQGREHRLVLNGPHLEVIIRSGPFKEKS